MKDNVYKEAINSGAYGGKILGAEAGGFLMFIAEASNKHEIISLEPNYLEDVWSDFGRVGKKLNNSNSYYNFKFFSKQNTSSL